MCPADEASIRRVIRRVARTTRPEIVERVAHAATPRHGALSLRPQQVPFDHPDSKVFFDKPLVPTRAAEEVFGLDVILDCLSSLRALAAEEQGIHVHQEFVDPTDLTRRLILLEGTASISAFLGDC